MNTIYDNTFVLGQTSATNFVAGPGITIDSPSAGTVRIGNDETLIYSGALHNSTAKLSEPYTNFKQIRAEFSAACDDGYAILNALFDTDEGNFTEVSNFLRTQTTGVIQARTMFAKFNNDVVSAQSWYKNVNATGAASQAGTGWLRRVYGINRISGGNE